MSIELGNGTYFSVATPSSASSSLCRMRSGGVAYLSLPRVQMPLFAGYPHALALLPQPRCDRAGNTLRLGLPRQDDQDVSIWQVVRHGLPQRFAGKKRHWHQDDVVQVNTPSPERSWLPTEPTPPHKLVASIAFLVFSLAIWT